MTTTTDDNAPVRGFHHASRAWYRAVIDRPEISIGLYHPKGGTSGEFLVRWHKLGSLGLAPCLEVFDDAWHVLPKFNDVLEGLAALRPVEEKASYFAARRAPTTEDEICALLLRCGLADLTAYTQGTDR